MGLLQEIIEGATDPQLSVSDLLRKSKILAYRLHNDLFKDWVEHELSGYTDADELPPYRSGFSGSTVATLSGPMNSIATRVSVPITKIPKGWDKADFRQGSAALETLARQANAKGDTSVRTSIPVEFYANLVIMQHMSTISMWVEFPTYFIEGILDAVKSKAQTFALEIEAEDPTAGELQGSTIKISPARVTQIFRTSIQADSVSLAQGNSGSVSQVAVSVIPGDVDSLLARLEELGVPSEDSKALREALIADAAAGATTEPGEKTKNWLAGTLWKLGASAVRVGEGVASGLVTVALAQYFGLNPVQLQH